ncbi:uncharacterized protein [Dermacentor andersoni]|uniref:uncharacterized protein isoform X2 n=1 Tax=Dermacentor andersoni TaxID=34620 RepID=UPI002417A33B|nr:uncharacterized protein LOC126545157 isoform X2 [Dermacentor andersoni]
MRRSGLSCDEAARRFSTRPCFSKGITREQASSASLLHVMGQLHGAAGAGTGTFANSGWWKSYQHLFRHAHRRLRHLWLYGARDSKASSRQSTDDIQVSRSLTLIIAICGLVALAVVILVAMAVVLAFARRSTYRGKHPPDYKETFNSWIDPVRHLEKTGILTRGPGKLFRCKSFFFAHLVGLAMVVTKPSILEPLTSTGRSSTLSCLYRRYLSTLRHVKCWYEGDIWGRDDAAALSIARVRQMHRDASAQLRHRRCPVSGATYLSQLDMAVTQFAFVGLVVLYPRQLGLSLSECELECVLHFWRCVGYKLGMADSYNLCSGNYRETFDVCLEMQEKLIKPGLVNASREASAMSKDIISAVRVLVIFLSYEGMMTYWARQVGLDFNAALSLYDWWSYCLIWLTFNLLLRYRTFRNMFNWLLRVAIRRGTKWGGYLQKQLEAQELHAKGMHLSYAYRYH